MTMVRAALIQCAWAGDKGDMIAKHVSYISDAAERGAQVVAMQELFFAPYFCPSQDPKFHALGEQIPDGPTTKVLQEQAQKHGIVIVAPMHENSADGAHYNTAAVIDADGTYLGKYRKTHIPTGFEEFYYRQGDQYPVFDTAVGKVGVYICYDRHFPEGARVLGLKGAELVFMPAATTSGAGQHRWFVEQAAHAIANSYWVGTINRVGTEDFAPSSYYGSSYFANPLGAIVARASDKDDECLVTDLDMEVIAEARELWKFHSNRRPELYAEVAAGHTVDF